MFTFELTGTTFSGILYNSSYTLYVDQTIDTRSYFDICHDYYDYEPGKEPTKYDCINFDCLFSHLASSQPIQPEPMYSEIALELILRVLLAIAQQVSTFTQFIKATLLSTFDMLTDIFKLCETLLAYLLADLTDFMIELWNNISIFMSIYIKVLC